MRLSIIWDIIRYTFRGMFGLILIIGTLLCLYIAWLCIKTLSAVAIACVLPLIGAFFFGILGAQTLGINALLDFLSRKHPFFARLNAIYSKVITSISEVKIPNKAIPVAIITLAITEVALILIYSYLGKSNATLVFILGIGITLFIILFLFVGRILLYLLLYVMGRLGIDHITGPLIILVIGVLLAVFIPRCMNSKTDTDSNLISPGSKVTLQSPDGSGIPLVTTKEAYQEMWRYRNSNRLVTQNAMVAAGTMFMVDSGTKAFVLDHSLDEYKDISRSVWIDTYLVKLLSGGSIGKSGWIDVNFVKPRN